MSIKQRPISWWTGLTQLELLRWDGFVSDVAPWVRAADGTFAHIPIQHHWSVAGDTNYPAHDKSPADRGSQFLIYNHHSNELDPCSTPNVGFTSWVSSHFRYLVRYTVWFAQTWNQCTYRCHSTLLGCNISQSFSFTLYVSALGVWAIAGQWLNKNAAIAK